MAKFAVQGKASESIAGVTGKPTSETGKIANSLASGVIAGVVAAIISHPADTLLSKINKGGAGGWLHDVAPDEHRCGDWHRLALHDRPWRTLHHDWHADCGSVRHLRHCHGCCWRQEVPLPRPVALSIAKSYRLVHTRPD